MESPEFITTAEAAKILNRTVRSIHYMMSRGDLTKIKRGNRTVVRREQVISYLTVQEQGSTRLDEVEQLHKLLMLQNEYIIRLDARVAMLETIIESRDSLVVLDATQLRVFGEMMKELMGKTSIEYSELRCWSSDVNKLSFESAKLLGIKELYVFVNHLATVLQGDTEFLGGFDLHRVKDSLTMAKHKLIAYAQLDGLTSMASAPFIQSIMTKLSQVKN